MKVFVALTGSLLVVVGLVNAEQLQHSKRVDTYGDPLPDGAIARLGTIRLRHCETVSFVRFAPDGKRLFSRGRDNAICIWDVATGREIRRFASSKQTGLGREGTAYYDGVFDLSRDCSEL